MTSSPEKADTVNKEQVVEQVKTSTYEELFDSSVSYIVRGVETGQIRFIQRAIRQTTSLRHDVDRSHITNIVHRYLPRTSTIFSVVKDSIDRLPMSDNVLIEPSTVPTTILPEVEVYLLHLVIVALLSAKLYEDAAFVSSVIVQHIKQYNRRTLDLLSAKVYYYFSISYEKIHKLENIRSVLMTAYQTACYHNDAMSQSTLLNLLIHNYLEYDLIEQIQILTEKTNIFSDAGSDSSFISHNQYCRYAYYIGRANAIQLEYSSAYALLSMALRKSPQEVAFGFATQTIKLIVLVQLLMGGIPERSIFNHTNMEVRAALIPYLYLTQAVRAGNIQQFHQIANHPVYKEVFRTDKNMSLVRRLGHNVLKTGLKKISMSYSRISFKDIAEKLHLSSPEATEFICAKAIRDGVIEASINHTKGWLINSDVEDIYSSEEPQKAFHKRIVFCLELHNDAVKAMRYPPSDDTKSKKSDKDSSNEEKNDEKTIDEIIKELEEEEDDFF